MSKKLSAMHKKRRRDLLEMNKKGIPTERNTLAIEQSKKAKKKAFARSH